MKVLIASAEAVPFAKVGGLADVIGSLPKALRKMGIDARVIMPGYGFIEHRKYDITRLFSFEYTHRNGTSTVDVYTCIHDSVPFYFVQAFPYFGNDPAPYTTWDWDVPRFIFFNQVVMAVAWELRERLDWFPEVVNVNDWHTALVPFLMSESRHKEEWSRVGTVTTIHNIAYQGSNVGGFLWDAGIPARTHPVLAHHGLTDNLLATAIAYSDMISTVSPRYAQEIQYAYAGYELAPLIRHRADDLVGILNGIDTELWNPATDKHLAERYDAETFSDARPANKHNLQVYARLPVDDRVPLIGLVSRLTWQKGLDLAVPALRQLLAEENAQFVILGTGEPEIEQEIFQLAQDFHWKVAAFLQYDAALAQHIYAGSDIFLMPSHFEPCGIGQMIAMRYGALPLVRETGGLADTVVNYDDGNADRGTGFVFHWEEPEAVLGTLRWAINTYHNHPDAWRRMQRRAMNMDFSWDQSARQYVMLYERTSAKVSQ